jgi:hypothetical protein
MTRSQAAMKPGNLDALPSKVAFARHPMQFRRFFCANQTSAICRLTIGVSITIIFML